VQVDDVISQFSAAWNIKNNRVETGKHLGDRSGGRAGMAGRLSRSESTSHSGATKLRTDLSTVPGEAISGDLWEKMQILGNVSNMLKGTSYRRARSLWARFPGGPAHWFLVALPKELSLEVIGELVKSFPHRVLSGRLYLQNRNTRMLEFVVHVSIGSVIRIENIRERNWYVYGRTFSRSSIVKEKSGVIRLRYSRLSPGLS
jgi:hypothetical protein